MQLPQKLWLFVQGSEAGTVVYVVGSPNNQTWQHVYTAVTRGKKQVYILTRQSYLQTAVLNTPRKSFLGPNHTIDSKGYVYGCPKITLTACENT